MSKWKLWTIVLAISLTAAAFFSVDARAGDEPLQHIIMAQPGHDDYGIPMYLADKLGYFKDEGLEVEFLNFKSSPLSVASLLAGEVQFCLTSYDQALKTFEKGKVLKILFTTTEKHPWCLIAKPEIKTVADLKGKRITAKMPGSGPRAFACNVLIQAGLNPDKDVEFADLGESAIMPAWVNGQIDATVGSGIRKAELLSRGATVLADMNDPAQHKAILGTDTFPLKVVLATEDYLKEHPDVAQKFANAVVRAMKWEESHSSAEIAQNVEQYFLGSISAEIIDDIRRPFSHTGLITQEGHNALEKQSIDVGLISKPVPMEKVVDLSFLEKAREKAGN